MATRQEIQAAAQQRRVREAQERHTQLENARIAREEADERAADAAAETAAQAARARMRST